MARKRKEEVADLTKTGPGLYYVGSDKVIAGWAKDSLGEAVQHATELLAKDPSKLSVNVVRVVRIVRRPVPVAITEIV